MPRGKKAVDTDKAQEPAVSTTLSDARANKETKLPKPSSTKYEVMKYINNNVQTIKIAKLEVIPGFGTNSTLVARLKKLKGKWVVAGGRTLSPEVKKAVKEAGYEV